MKHAERCVGGGCEIPRFKHKGIILIVPARSTAVCSMGFQPCAGLNQEL